jgi:hypothetical protein
VFVGHRHGEVVARYAGLGQTEHPAFDLGESEKREKSCSHSSGSSTLSHPFYVLFLQLLSWGSADVPMLLVEVTRAWEAAAIAEAARVLAVLAVETST